MTAPVAKPDNMRLTDLSRQAAVLYISYDGMLEPLGQSQVIGYLERLAARRPIHLISFEKRADRADAPAMRAMRERLARAGIAWIPLTYHKRPSAAATSWDIATGIAVGLAVMRKHRIRIVHARSYVPAAMALSLKRLTGAKFLFDMRGFWADERVDGGLWRRDSRLYRAAKALERRFLLGADHVVTLTHSSVREMRRFDYVQGRDLGITVIPTCADLERFRPLPFHKDSTFTFGYVGSVGTWYLFDETLMFFKILSRHRPGARLLIVNRAEHAAIGEAVSRMGIEPGRVELVAASHPEVPNFINRMHVASAFIKPCYSKIASAATKLGEYLGCGVPCAGNVGVGDMEDVIETNRVGVAVSGFTEPELAEAATRLLDLVADPATPARCVATARRLFAQEDGAAAYEALYARLSRPTP